MNIPENADMTEMGWDRTEAEKGVSWKLQNVLDPDFPQECVGNYVKKTSIPYESSSDFSYTFSTAKEIAGTGSPKLDRVTLGKPGMKKSFSDIVRG